MWARVVADREIRNKFPVVGPEGKRRRMFADNCTQ